MSGSLTDSERLLMGKALQLAERGRGRVSPNPLVGAVVLRDGEPIGEGWHDALGGLHAERAALEDCRERGNDPAGATLCVTLEPCAHHGRQPPCVDAILEAGISRVVVGSEDPSAKASGRGPGMLRDSGVEVVFAAGEEATAARLLNQPFRKHARTGRPHVLLKMATSLDGRVAARGGDSRWISGEQSRAMVHRWRAWSDAVAIGIGTALRDDPLLTAREVDAQAQPTRIVFDSDARLPPDSRLVRTVAEAPLIVVSLPQAPGGRVGALREAGAEVLIASGDTPPERVVSALSELGRRGITSVLLEGGPRLAGAFLTAGEVDEASFFIAPVLLGGGRAAVEGEAVERISDGVRALAASSRQCGEDTVVTARFREW